MAAVYLAVGLVWAVWVAVGVAAVGPRTTTNRKVIGGAFLVPVVFIVGTIGRVGVEAWRRSQILEGGECRPIPFDERPRSIIEITCGDLQGLTYLVVVGFLAPIALALATVAWMVLRDVPVKGMVKVIALAGAVVFLVVLAYLFVGSSSAPDEGERQQPVPGRVVPPIPSG